RNANQVKEAIDILKPVCDAMTRTLPPDHPDTLIARGTLATAYREDGRVGEAIIIFKEVQPKMIEKLGRTDVNTLRTSTEFASAYISAGAPQAVIRLLEPFEKELIPIEADDDYALALLNNLATGYVGIRKFHDARRVLEYVREKRVGKGTDDHLTL